MLYDIVQVRSDCKVPFRKKMNVMMMVVITKHTREMTIEAHGSRSGRCGQKVARFKPCAEPHVRAGEGRRTWSVQVADFNISAPKHSISPRRSVDLLELAEYMLGECPRARQHATMHLHGLIKIYQEVQRKLGSSSQRLGAFGADGSDRHCMSKLGHTGACGSTFVITTHLKVQCAICTSF